MKAIVSLSGGLDSTTLLARVVEDFGKDNVQAVGFRYGSKHNELEVKAARKVAAHYDVRYKSFNLYPVFAGFHSALMEGDTPVPEGHYEKESMRQTVVPGRNIIFASVLAGYAMSEKVCHVYLGIHAGDHFIYPDCRPEFYNAMAQAVVAGTGGVVILLAPFLNNDKAAIVKLGLVLKVPYYLTRTCYQSTEPACGKCGSCQERLTAFAANNAVDPLSYATRELMPKK